MVMSPMSAVAQDPNHAIREALEAVARELETRSANAIYQQAWKAAAKIIRSHKPEDPNG